MLNASVDGNDTSTTATSTSVSPWVRPVVWVVPIPRNADQMSFAEIEEDRRVRQEGGKEGKLGIEEMTGGTFSISEWRHLWLDDVYPIINPPQSAILGVRDQGPRCGGNGQIVIRPMNYMCVCVCVGDVLRPPHHRRPRSRAGPGAMKDALEDPARLLLTSDPEL